MSGANVIPAWLQWAWAFAGLGVAVGGLCWILLIFWPYLRWSKKMTIRLMEMTDESLKLARATVESMKDVQRIVDKLEALVNRIAGLVAMLPEEEAKRIIGWVSDLVKKVKSSDQLKVEVQRIQRSLTDQAKKAMTDLERIILTRINALIGDILFSSNGVESQDTTEVKDVEGSGAGRTSDL